MSDKKKHFDAISFDVRPSRKYVLKDGKLIPL